MLNSANYPSGHAPAIAGADKWDVATGNPIIQVTNAREVVRSKTGRYPNTLALSPKAFNGMRNNPFVIDRLKYTSDAVVTTDILARLLNLMKVVVGEAVVADQSGVFSDVWGNDAVLAYVPMNATQEVPAFAYTYTMVGHPMVEQTYYEANSKSDQKLDFANALRLPIFELELMRLIKRLTLIISNGQIEKVFYPVFPPDKNAEEVISWLSNNTSSSY